MSNYEFTTDWFSKNIPTWDYLVKKISPVKKILEIGSFEGMSTVWLINNVFKNSQAGEIFCVDTWEGGVEHDSLNMSAVEMRFEKNIELAKAESQCNAAIVKLKGRSQDILSDLLSKEHRQSFDFIYVDGSHECADVLTDLVLSYHLCRSGGVIVCDDYLWSMETHGNEDLLNQPKLAIDSFVNCYRRKVSILSGAPLYQLYLQKTSP
jgi:predicted O-methyltransferase YrrM